MEAVFRTRAAKAGLDLEFDSAGTESYHVGNAPDPRSQTVARTLGYELSHLRARHVRTPNDFEVFDLILAADRTHLTWLESRCPPEHQHKLALVLRDANLPDPYYGEHQGFLEVLDAVETAAEDWLQRGLGR